MTTSRRLITMVALFATIVTTGSGCRALVELFETMPGAATDGGTNTDGAVTDGAVTDGASPAIDAPRACNDWAFVPVHFDPCSIAAANADVTLSPGDWQYDTNSGALTDPNFDVVFPPSVLMAQAGGAEVRVVSVDLFTVSNNARLRVVGQRPLIIAAWKDVRISGTINVSSSTSEAGAGADPEACSATAPTVGASDADGSGGGGGGGFAAPGGDGGDGDAGNGPGGSAGTSISLPSTVRGGCAGAVGGRDIAPGAAGGLGGGAVHITSRTIIRVDGGMNSGGGGGDGGNAGRGGGGGGGAGGYLGLEAPSVRIDRDAVMVSNGGGGGGGCDNNQAQPGDDGRIDTQPAAGGTKEGMGTSGGDGGAFQTSAGQPSTASNRGGGGGGGGAGFTVVYTQTPDIDSQAIISPQLIEPGWQQ